MEITPGRGWTIFQRRVDGSEDFYRNWTDYKTGFGNLSGEFWLGLDKIHRLSANGQNVLRVDLESFENETAHAVYDSFSIRNESEAYILNIDDYPGNNKYINLKYSLIIRKLVANHVSHNISRGVTLHLIKHMHACGII
jgi:hypothetical protein